MKKIWVFLLFVLSMTSFPAQQNYRETLSTLVKNSENGFADILGPKISDSEFGSKIYDSKIKLGIGNEYFEQIKNAEKPFYVLHCEYFLAQNLEKEVEEFISSSFPASVYNIKAEKSEILDSSYIDVFEKGSSVPVFSVIVEVDPKMVTNYTIHIYSRQK